MANGGRIDYTIGFKVDQSGLNQIKANLTSIQQGSTKDFVGLKGLQDADKKLIEIKKTASDVEAALNRSFNSNLGTLNISKFNQELKKLDIKKISSDFSQLGPVGQNAFRNITSQILTTNLQLKQTNKWLDEMATTMANSVKWGVTSAIWNNMTGAVEKAWNFTKKLDTSLNDIRIVTQKSADDMERYAIAANKAAKNLGQTTTQYTNASLIYYQQGLSDAEVQARTETTLKAANVTGQSAADVSEQLTAVWNGYKVNAQEAELYVDKLSAVAATTAADLEELSTGMSKVASAASIMGVDIDQLNAQLATVVSVTRQAPESVGTAFKTIYARMGDIEAGLDTETSLGEYTKKMNEMGFNVLDTNGKLKDMGSVIEEIGNKWTNLSREQQVALSQIMAGTRQYNNLLALFDNWDMYSKSIETSKNATGALQRQQDIYMESMEAHLQQLQAAGEGVYNALFNAEDVNPIIDALTGVTNLFKNFVDAAGGAQGLLLLLGNTAVSVFSKQIASGLATTIANFKTAKENANQLQAEMEILSKYENANINDSRTQNLINMKREILNYDKVITAEERNQANEIIRQTNELYKQQDALQNKKLQVQSIYEQMTGEILLFPEGQDLGENQISNYANKIEAEINDIKNKISGLNKDTQAFNQTETIFKGLTKGTQEYRDALDSLLDISGRYQNATKELLDLETVSASQREKITQALNKYEETIQKVKAGEIDEKNIIRATRDLRSVYGEVIKENAAALNTARESLKGMKQEQKNLNDSLTAGRQAWKQYLSQIDLKAKAQQVINFANGLGRVSMTLSSLGRIDDIFKDVNLSAGEKLLQIMSALSMTIPGVVAIASAIGKITGATGLLQAKLAFMVITQEKEAAARAKNTIAKKLENDATKQTLRLLKTEDWARKEKIGVLSKEAALEKAEELITKAKIPADSLEAELIRQEIRLRHANAAAIEKENIFKALQEKLTWANIKAKLVELKTKTKELWNSFNGLTGGAKIFAGALGAIAVTAAITTGTLAFVNRDINQLTEEAKKASESLNTLTETYNAAKSAFENFQSEISDYKEAKAALDDMVTGTEEWKNAVQDVNKQVIDLISNYKELTPYVQKNESGVLSISEEGMRVVEGLERDKLNNQYQQLNAARINNSQAQSDLAIGQTKEDMEVFGDFGAATIPVLGGAIGSVIGATLLGSIGILAGPLGIIVGAAAGAALGGLTSGLIEEFGNVQEEDIEAVTDAYSNYGEELFKSQSNFSKIMSKASGVTENEIDALWANREKLIELSRSVEANTQAQQAYMQQYVQSALEGNEIYESSKDKQDLEKMVVVATNKNLDTFVDKWKDKIGGKTDAEIQKAYAKLMKWETTSIDNQIGNKATYYFSDGTSKTIDDATARYALAMAEASKNATESLREFQLTIDSVNQKLNSKGLDNEMLSTFFEGKVGDLSNYTEAEIKKLSGIDFTDEEAIARGYENAQDLEDKIDQAQENFKKWFSETTNKTIAFIGDARYAALDTVVAFEKLSLTANKHLSQAVMDAFKYGGDEGLNALLKMLQNVPEDKMEDFLALVGNIDFTNANAFDVLKESIEALGLELSDFDGFNTWGKIIEEAIDRNQTFESSIDKIISKLQTVTDILNDLSVGDIISKEKYDTLISFNSNLADFFQALPGGEKYRNIGFDLGGWQEIEGTNNALDIAEIYIEKLEQQRKLYEDQQKLKNENNSSYSLGLTKIKDQAFSSFDQRKSFEKSAIVNWYGTHGDVLFDGKNKEGQLQDIEDFYDRYYIANKEEREKIQQEYLDYIEKNWNQVGLTLNDFPTGAANKPNPHIRDSTKNRLPLLQDWQGKEDALILEREKIFSLNREALNNIFSAPSLDILFEQMKNIDPSESMEKYEELYSMMQNFYKEIDTYNNKVFQTKRDLKRENEILTQTTSLEELNTVFTRGIGTIDEYLKQYRYLSREVAIATGIEEKQIQLYKDKIDAIDGMTNHMAEAASAQILLTQVGLKDLADNWEDQLNKISNLDKFAPDYINAVDQIAESLSQVFAVEKDFFTDDFIKAHQEDITKIVNGDKEAFDRLGDIITDKVQTALQIDLMKVGGLELVNNFNDLIDGLQDHLDTLSFGDKIDKTFSEQMAIILKKAGKTSSQIMAIFRSMGIAINESWLTSLEIGTLLEQGNYEDIIAAYGNDAQKREMEVTKHYAGNQLSPTYFKQVAENIAASYATEGTNAAIYTGTEDIVDSLTTTDKEEKKKIDLLDDEIDRYHDINILLDDMAKKIERVNRVQEHLVGADWLATQEQGLKLLEEEIELRRQKQEIQQAEAVELQGHLLADGVKFFDDGSVANYAEIMTAQLAKANQARMSGNEDVADAAEKNYEAFKENFERYEELRDEIEDLADEITDMMYEQISKKVETFTTKLTIELDTTQAQKEWKEFTNQLFISANNALAQITAQSEIYSANRNIATQTTGKYEQIVNEGIKAQSLVEGAAEEGTTSVYAQWSEELQQYIFDQAKWQEDMQASQQEAQEAILQILDDVDALGETAIGLLEDTIAAQKEQLAVYDDMNSLLNHSLKLQELFTGEKDYDAKGRIYAEQATISDQKARDAAARRNYALSNIDTYAQAYNEAKQKYDEAVANGTGDVTVLEKQLEITKQAYEDMKNELKESTDDFYSSIEEQIEAAKNVYVNIINKAMADMEKMFTGGKGLSYINEEWDLINKNAERYLDTVNSTYEVQALEAKYMKAMDSTSNLNVQKKLNKIMEEELEALREKDKLSQYDIDRANKKYELTMKQIALEEAQANKSTMRLRRDAQGNYSYQFVANEEEVSDAQQDLLTAQNDLYNFDKERYQQTLDDALSTYQEYQQKMLEAAQINDPVARAEQEKLITEQYQQLMLAIVADNETAKQNLGMSTTEALQGQYDINKSNFEAMTQGIFDNFSSVTEGMSTNFEMIMSSMVTGWNDGVQNMIDKIAGDGPDGFKQQSQNAFNIAQQAAQEFDDKLTEIGENFSGDGNTADKILSDVQEINDKIDSFKNDVLDPTIAKAKEEIPDAWAKYKEGVDKAATAMLTLATNISTVWEKADELSKKLDTIASQSPINVEVKYNTTGEATNPSGNHVPGGNEGAKNTPTPIKTGLLEVGNELTWTGRKDFPRKMVHSTDQAEGVSDDLKNTRWKITTVWARTKSWGEPWYNIQYGNIKASIPDYAVDKSNMSFDTGGYTGEWGSEGRMAMLHEKEIVLNKDDTANILNAVSIVRGIGDMVGNLSATLLGGLSQRIIDPTLGLKDFEQTVHITADFPNVTSSSEIEDALRNLTNVAAQRAFSTRV